MAAPIAYLLGQSSKNTVLLISVKIIYCHGTTVITYRAKNDKAVVDIAHLCTKRTYHDHLDMRPEMKKQNY